MGTKERYERQFGELQKRGQLHVLRWWGELDDSGHERLLSDLESIPWSTLDALISTHVLNTPDRTIPADIRPADVFPRIPTVERKSFYADAIQMGRGLLQDGKVAAFTVAGGQGTRLGFDGPKGAMEVTPVGKRTLFQIFAETVSAARTRYEHPIPWYIMTSPANHAQTLAFLEERDFFGLPQRDVVLFSQGMLPAFDRSGRLLLEEKCKLALAPDGHGGSLTALVKSGALADMRSRGVEIVSYFQVDNPLVKPFDPLFIGLHGSTDSQMSTKVARKVDDQEKVGNVCVCDGKVTVIEYSDFPNERARARDANGHRLFDAGNLAMHLLDVDFVDRVVGRSFDLPFRRAEKKVAFIDDDGTKVTPDAPNAVKLETFVFDVIPMAAHPLVLEVDRAEEFSPVKNREGVDSIESSKRDQIRRAVHWLEDVGVDVPKSSDGSPEVTVAISPRFALDRDDLVDKVIRLPKLHRGDSVYIE